MPTRTGGTTFTTSQRAIWPPFSNSLSADEAASIAGLEVIVKNAQAGDGHTDTIHKIKVWDKVRSLEMAAKHFGLLLERVEHTASAEMLAVLHEGRERVAKSA